MKPVRPAWGLALAFVLVLASPTSFSWISAFIGLSVRALTIGRADALAPALGTLAWLLGLLLIFVPLAVRAFRRA